MNELFSGTSPFIQRIVEFDLTNAVL